MKKRLLAGLAVGVMMFVGGTEVVGATPLSSIVYTTDFQSAITNPPWSNTNITTSTRYTAGDSYHGNYSNNQSTTLTLTGLGAHTQLALDFDLLLFSTWDGNDTYYGPDYFSLTQDISGSWTFTNHQTEGQSYNGSPDQTFGGAGMEQTHVYRDFGPNGATDGFLINHTGSTFSVTFGGPTTQADEWWGIDNVTVSTNTNTAPVPEPATMLLMGSGLAGLIGARRKKKA